MSDPTVLLLLAAALIAFVIQSGELGTADTTHRLQSTHSFWTNEPPVFPDEYPEFGVHGRDGKLQSWYGIGQSLLMLPPDIVGTYVERLPIFAEYNGNDPSVRDIVVSYLTNMLVAVLVAMVCFRFLILLGFRTSHAAAGVVALLCATTFLHYTQNMMENNYIFLLTLTGFSYQYEWVREGNPRALMIGSAAFGLNLLSRLTTGLDLLAGGFFILLVLLLEKKTARDLRQRCLAYIRVALPVYGVFLFLDRLYQYHRFGSFWNTYVSVVAREARRRNPSLSPKYPFETPFHLGFFGALFTPEKSIFLFDPLLILMILVAAVFWKRFSPAVKAYVIGSAALLLAYICFYARYTVWSGDDAWGDRYVSTSAQLAALLAVPLLLNFRALASRWLKIAGASLVAAATAIQIASVCFWCPLELYQITPGHPTFVIGLRFKNIVAFALGKMGAWGLMNPGITDDPWDYVHITTWNFLGPLLKRSGFAPAWAVHVVYGVWYTGLAALACTLWRLRQVLKDPRSSMLGILSEGLAFDRMSETQLPKS